MKWRFIFGWFRRADAPTSVRALRLHARMSQEYLAARAGLTCGTVHRAERDWPDPPSPRTQRRVAEVLGGGRRGDLAHPGRGRSVTPTLCGRLLVGQGTDTWDPNCALPSGHAGPCLPQQNEPRSEPQKFLETVAGERCPCGHLKQRHRKPTLELEGEVMGACRDCDCKGLISWRDEEEVDAA